MGFQRSLLVDSVGLGSGLKYFTSSKQVLAVPHFAFLPSSSLPMGQALNISSQRWLKGWRACWSGLLLFYSLLSSSSCTHDFAYQEFNISGFYKCIDRQSNLPYRDEADSVVIKNKINAKGGSRLQ